MIVLLILYRRVLSSTLFGLYVACTVLVDRYPCPAILWHPVRSFETDPTFKKKRKKKAADFLAIYFVALLALLPHVGRFASTVLYVVVGDWGKARGVSLWRDLPRSFLDCEIERGTENQKSDHN